MGHLRYLPREKFRIIKKIIFLSKIQVIDYDKNSSNTIFYFVSIVCILISVILKAFGKLCNQCALHYNV